MNTHLHLQELPPYTTDLASVDTLRWSGPEPVPAIGDTVHVNFNAIGACRVVSYATVENYLGLMVYPLDPPTWWIKQNGAATPANAAVVYGAELARKG